MQAIPLLSNAVMHTATITASGSKVFLKKLVPSILAFIIHQRTDMARENFEPQTRKGITFWIFKNTNSKVVHGISDTIKGALDALEKNYLRELYLIFHDKGNPENVVESYKLSFKYLGADVISAETSVTRDDLEESTNNLLESIKGLDLAKPLSCRNISMQIMLTYYEEITPIDYQPPSFTYDDSLQDILTNHSKLYIQLGLIKTKFHTLKIRGKGDVFNYVRDELYEGSTQEDEMSKSYNSEPIPISDDSDATNI